MFSRVNRPELEARIVGYSPAGYSPFARPDHPEDYTLVIGDFVQVESVWERPYLPGAPLLAYVYSETTGQHSHVLLSDLIDPHTLTRVA